VHERRPFSPDRLVDMLAGVGPSSRKGPSVDRTVKTPVLLLSLAAIIDIGAAPFFLAGDDASVGVIALIFGVLTAAAAFGLARHATWARRLGIATRALDGLLALPGIFFGGVAGGIGAAVVVVISFAAVVLLVRMARQPAMA